MMTTLLYSYMHLGMHLIMNNAALSCITHNCIGNGVWIMFLQAVTRWLW